MHKQMSQTEIIMYFHKINTSPSSPSASSASSTCATPESKPTPSCASSSSATQCEDKDEDFYGDPLPLPE